MVWVFSGTFYGIKDKLKTLKMNEGDYMINNRLSVMLTARDRSVLTQKTIESILTTTSLFRDIDIYVFDNLSLPSPERFAIFAKLLKDGKIKYYSYDTSTSLNNCFGKASSFHRWTQMMKTAHDVRHLTKTETMNDYYVLIDNDVILGRGWDKYFLNAHQELKTLEPNTHYIVKAPGGIPKIARDNPMTNNYTFNVDGEEFGCISSSWGGGSCFWFFDYNQLLMLEWESEELVKTYNCYKKQDSTSWFMIKRRKGIINFVAGVKPPKDDDPLVLHVGEVLQSSMCNVLTRQGPDVYRRTKHTLEDKELSLRNLSAKQIYDKYKHLTAATVW